MQLDRDIQATHTEVGEAEREAIYAKEAYRKARDIAFMKAEGPQYMREVVANQATEAERVASELAAQKAGHLKDRAFMIRDRMKTAQSIGALLRSEMNL